jgi:hypothetical protein
MSSTLKNYAISLSSSTVFTHISKNICGFVYIALLFVCVAPLALAQTLTSTSPIEDPSIQIGGQVNGLGGVGILNWNNAAWIAYSDNSQNGNVWLTHTTDGVNFAAPVQVVINGPQTVNASSNPTLGFLNGNLLIAWIDPSGSLDFTWTSDGTHFQTALGLCTNGGATASPSSGFLNGITYLGYQTTPAHQNLWVDSGSGSRPRV